MRERIWLWSDLGRVSGEPSDEVHEPVARQTVPLFSGRDARPVLALKRLEEDNVHDRGRLCVAPDTFPELNRVTGEFADLDAEGVELGRPISLALGTESLDVVRNKEAGADDERTFVGAM